MYLMIVLLKDEEMDVQSKEARKFVNQKEAKELFVSDVFPDTESANKASKKSPNLQNYAVKLRRLFY